MKYYDIESISEVLSKIKGSIRSLNRKKRSLKGNPFRLLSTKLYILLF